MANPNTTSPPPPPPCPPPQFPPPPHLFHHHNLLKRVRNYPVLSFYKYYDSFSEKSQEKPEEGSFLFHHHLPLLPLPLLLLFLLLHLLPLVHSGLCARGTVLKSPITRLHLLLIWGGAWHMCHSPSLNVKCENIVSTGLPWLGIIQHILS